MGDEKREKRQGNTLPKVTLTLSPALYQRILEEADKGYIRPSTWVESIIRDVVTEMDKRAQSGNEQPPQDQPEQEPPKKDDGGIF